MTDLLEHPFINAVLPHLLTIGGFLLALFAIARLLSEKRPPGNTMAWLLVLVLIPYVGVPLYLIFSGRKLRRVRALKRRVRPALPGKSLAIPASCINRPVASVITASGACEPLAGNRLSLLTTGEDAYAALEAGIISARKTIHIATFILGRDDTGRRIIRLLAKRAKEGVKVRLLLDSVGSMFLSRDFYAALKKAGGEVQWFMPVMPFTSRGSANLRNHRKIAVFDHTTAIVGGHNLAREYMGATPLKKRWADFGGMIEGPAAVLLNEVFIADWCFTSRQPADPLRAEIPPDLAVQSHGEAELQVIASGPDVPGDPLYEGILSMIQEANHSITIITPYFIPDEVLQRSLIVKARAGLTITIVVPARSNHPITDFARRHYLRELHKAGVKIMHYKPGMMHSKAIIVDDTMALFGSANIDLRSLFVNFEVGVLVHSTAEVRAMKNWAEGLMKSSQLITSEPVRKYRLLGNITEDLSRLFAPLL